MGGRKEIGDVTFYIHKIKDLLIVDIYRPLKIFGFELGMKKLNKYPIVLDKDLSVILDGGLKEKDYDLIEAIKKRIKKRYK
ncbi:MAG TPA: hypothetical protein ENI70_01590 [Candidatus Peregrinibacteria bacterium]|nr:hypothetical protein [Candidatus Peregrinibacteria bacterium]